MHGLSIMQGLMNAVAESAACHGISQVELIRIKAGDLSGVPPEELRFAFSLVLRDAVFQNTELEIKSVPGSREIKVDFYEGITSPLAVRRPSQPSSRP